MAGPVPTYVQLPSDTSNTGKKNRTQTKVVGSDTVHEHFVVPSLGITRVGRYMMSSTANQVISATSQTGTGSGNYWLHMSSAATVTAALRHVSIQWGQVGAAVASPTMPQIAFWKYTFNTAHSGTTLNMLQYHTTGTAPQANIRSTSSGATVTLVGQAAVMPLPAIFTTVGVYGGHAVLMDIDEHYNRMSAVEFGPGEGIVVFQPTAGTASDTRAFTVRMVWDEYDFS